MILKVINKYKVYSTVDRTAELEIEIRESDLFDIIDKDQVSMKEIEELLIDHLRWEEELHPNEKDDVTDDDEETIITNFGELIPYLEQFLPERKECCKRAPFDANYCPTCGERLK